jgi:CRISPR-associated endonuclease/helicase Cas3
LLLAKSEPPVGLRRHTDDVREALSRLRLIWPEIPPTLDVAAIFHDVGKAATGFQEMLKGSREDWKFRHEVLSAAIFRQCYSVEADDLRPAYLALLAHHKNLGSADGINRELRACGSHTQYSRWQEKWRELTANSAELKEEFAHVDAALDKWCPQEHPTSPVNELLQIIAEIAPVLDDRNLATARGALVAADHVASAALGRAVLGGNILPEALDNYAHKHIEGWTQWRDLQRRAGKIIGSAELVAPTGSGKTEAALLWALANRRGFERIFYVLPYQVSINAMAARFANAFPDEENREDLSSNENVSILHANVDLAYLRDAQDEQLSDEEARSVAAHKTEAARKIYAPIKVTTVFQLLDIFFGRKFFEVGLLELSHALVILDEIHAYDGHTMGLILVLLETLQKLGARILIMTATLPKALQTQLCASAGIREAMICLSSDDPLLAEARRQIIIDEYLVEQRIDQISDAVCEGKRTAVVCNTVDKAIKLYDALRELNPLLVHSRFTLGDRASRERKSNIDQHQLVISTQVIEVSLDVSFDVLFTELAPADSLIQRFGRVNRHGQYNAQKPGLCHILCGRDSGSETVYGRPLLELTKQNLPNEPLTFDATRRWIEGVYPRGLTEKEEARMLDSSANFRKVIAQLKPMIDAPARLDEPNLFESIQVIPLEMETEWKGRKRERNHTEAKKLVVNVNLHSWNDAIRGAKGQIRQTEEGQMIAPFRYDPERGLLLKEPI